MLEKKNSEPTKESISHRVDHTIERILERELLQFNPSLLI